MDSSTKKDLEILVGNRSDAAKNLLANFKEFYPFGSKIDQNGKFIPVNHYDGDEFPLSDSVIEKLTDYLQNEFEQNKIIAYSIIYDVRVRNDIYPEAIDAIAISIKHQDVDGKLLYHFPYQILENNQIEYYEAWGENEG